MSEGKLQARESHPAVEAYEAPLDTRPPAMKEEVGGQSSEIS